MPRPTEQIDPRDLFIKSNPTGLAAEELEKDRSGFVDLRTHSDYLIFLAGYEAGAETNQIDKNSGHRDQVNAEGCKPEISIQPASSTAGGTVAHGLDKAEGEQPDLNFHLLLLAERSCSLLEDWTQVTNATDETLINQIRETRSLLESQSPTWTTAIRDILAERRRQIHEGSYAPQHDDKYTGGELAEAASAYAFWAHTWGDYVASNIDYLDKKPPAIWPWSPEYWKPISQRLMLIKAGALLLAELGRLDRMAAEEVHRES